MAKTTEMLLDANLTGNLGDTVTVGGKNYIIGATAFGSLQDAVTAAANIPGDVAITVKGGTYADDIDFTTPLDKNAGISFVAAKDETVIFSGKTTLGYRNQGVGAKMWNGPISFTGITFDQAKAGEHSIDVQDVKGLVLRNCTIIGDGEYGIGSSRGNATAPSSIIGCTFENASIQVTGNFGTGLVIDGCTFNESRVNVQSGNSVTIQNSTFSRTLTDAAVGDSFYLIRSNSNPITIKNCVANVDSELKTTPENQEEWALLWARNANGPKWNVDGLEVNMTDAAMAQGSLDVIKNGKIPAQNTPDRINVSGLTSNQEIADIIAKTDGSVNIFTEGGYASYKDGVAEKTFSFTTVYVNSTFTGTFGEEIETGKFFGINAFADINAAEIAAEASAVKMVIEEGSDVTYTKDQYYFLNTNESLNADSEGNKINAFDEVVGADDSYDLEVNGTLRAYQVLLNNAETTVSATGRLLATGENFRVMGGTITVQGPRKADAAAPAEVFTGSWGGGTKAGADTQIQGGYLDINQGAEAAFNDTVIFVHAGFFNVNASTAAFDNTYIYLGSGGTYADIQMNITNGAEVTFANNTTVLNDAEFGMHVTVGEGSKLNLNNATFALDNSKKTTSLTNNGIVTVSGESTVVIGTVTGNGIILDDATLTAASNIANSPATKIYGTSTIKGTVGTVHANYTDTKVNDKRIGYTTEAVALTLDGATTGSVYVGSDTEGYAATLTVKGGSKTGQIYSRVYGTTTITGSGNTIKYINAKGSVNIVDAADTTITEGIVAEAGNIAITNSTVSLGIGGNYVTQLDKGTTMTVTGSTVNVQGLSIDATSALELSNSTVTVTGVYGVGTITNNGAISIDATSAINATTLSGAGNITIDATGMAADSIKTIVDVTSSTFTGTISVTGNEANNATYYTNSQGDIILSTVSGSKLYVNAAWAGKEVGTEVETGKYFGINAFATTKEAYMAARDAGGEITINLNGAGAETLDGTVGFGNAGKDGIYTITGGSMETTSYGISFANTNTTVKFDKATFKVAKIYVANSGGTLIVNDSVIGSAYYSGNNGGWVTAGKGSISITDSIFGMNFANFTDVENMPRSASEVKDAVKDGTYKYWQFGANNSGPHMGTAGEIAVTGSTLSTSWISLIDRAEMVLDNSVLYYGAAISIGAGQVDNSYGSYNSNEIGWDAQIWWNPVLSSAAGYREGEVATLTVQNSIVRNIGGGNGNDGAHVQVGGSYVNGIDKSVTGECAGVLNLINSEFYTTPYDVNGNAIAKDYDMIVVKSNGTVNVTNSKLVSAKVINEGTFTVSGESTLDIDLIKGNDITASGVLKNSDLTFEVFDYQTGNVMVDQALEVQGGSFKNVQFRADENEKITLTGAIQAIGATQFKAVNGEIVVNGAFSSEVGEASSIEIEGDASKLTIAADADVKITGGFYLNGGTTIINGNLDPGTADAKVELERTDADVETAYATLGDAYAANVTVKDAYIWNSMASINNAGTQVTLDNSRFDGWMSFDMNGGTLTVQNGSYLYHQAAEGWTRSTLAGNLIVKTGSVFNANKTNVTHSGNLTFDETAKITVGSIVNTGTINFTVSGEAATNYFGGLVIDANATSDYGQVNIDVEGRDGFVSFVKDNDLYVADTKTIFVSNEWNCDTEGSEIKTNVYYGVNAFDLADFNAGSCSEGSRRVVFSYNGEDTVAGLVITVTGTNTSYAFDGDGKKVNFNSGSYTHEVTLTNGSGEFVFDFAKGDYQISVEAIKENEATPGGNVVDGSTIDLEETRVDEVAGNKVVTFTVAAGTVQDMTFNYQTLDGTVRLVLTGPDGKKTTKLFSADDGSFTFEKLKEGDYTVEFSGYGYEEEAEFKGSFTFEAVDAEELNNTSDNAALFGTGIVDNFVGTGDTMDWFMIDNLAAGNHELAFDFTAQNGGYAIVTLYAKQGENAAQQIDIFYLQDLKSGIADELRNFAVADGTDLYIQIQSRGEGGNFSIALDQ